MSLARLNDPLAVYRVRLLPEAVDAKTKTHGSSGVRVWQATVEAFASYMGLFEGGQRYLCMLIGRHQIAPDVMIRTLISSGWHVW